MGSPASVAAAILDRAVIRTVMFDLFDTLVDLDWGTLPQTEVLGRLIRSTHRALHESLSSHSAVDFDTFARALREVDRELRAARAAAGLELPTIERFTVLLDRLGVPDPAVAQELTLVHMAGIRTLVRPIDHHAAVLERLRGRVSLAVCSNFSHAPTAHKILEEVGLLHLVDAVVISEEVGVRKPWTEIFRAALERVGAAPEETLHVGDQLVADVEGAARAGILPVWVTRRVADPEAALEVYTGPPPVHVIRDLAELEPLLDGRPGDAPRPGRG
jgi:putative hydrolase of the HAD superfamily